MTRPHFEVFRPLSHPNPFQIVICDFDGTVSLLREGWARIMAELGRDLIREQKLQRESETELLSFLEREMLFLSGKPSIFQMQRLAQEVSDRGGRAPDADQLLTVFLDRLTTNIRSRIEDLSSGSIPPSHWTVPGTHQLLDRLRDRGLQLALVSGTDRAFVESDLKLLDLDRYFGPHVYCPSNQTPNFTKRDVIEMLLRETGASGAQVLGFGDGYSETVEVKRIGGVAIGVASAEPGHGRLNEMKRDMLIQLGADAILPDYQEPNELFRWLGI